MSREHTTSGVSSGTGSRYATVGCPECQQLWIIDRREYDQRITCRQCGKTYDRRRLSVFASADDIEIAREQRSRVFADQAGHGDLGIETDDWGQMEDRVQASIEADRARFEDLVSTDREDRFEAAAEALLERHDDRFSELVENPATGRSTSADPPDPPGEPSLSAVVAGEQPGLGTLPVRNVGPRASEWLPAVLESLLPTLTEAARELGPEDVHHSELAEALIEEYAMDAIKGTGAHDRDAAIVAYLDGLARWATGEDRSEELERRLTRVGTGESWWNAGVPVLDAVAAVLSDASTPTVRVYLDAEAWTSLDHRETGERALDALRRLAHGTEVELVLSSPSLTRALLRRYEDWFEAYLDFTEDADWYRLAQDELSKEDAPDLTPEEALAEIEQPGQIRTLANLPEDGQLRQQRLLIGDPDVDLSESGVSRAVSALVDAGLVDRDISGRHNTVRLTETGQAALEYISDDYTIRHPEQAQLRDTPLFGGDFTETPHADTSTVYCAGGPGEGGKGDRTAEAQLQATGSAREDGYVQWLPASANLDKWAMHKRLTGAKRGSGVTLVDDRIGPQEDGRVARISCFEDEFLAVVEWGGPLPTMARLASALLSDRALSKVLTPDRTGEEFEELHTGDVEGLMEDVIRFGHQVGWFSGDETRWKDWRKRYGSVKAALLEMVGKVGDDPDARRELMRDLHGLIASATHLYFAAGVDVVFNLRIPDTTQLGADQNRVGDFLDFMRYTVSKNTVYGVHSGYRMLLEHRDSKLKRRLAYEIDPADPGMDLTASWVVSGPAITELQSDIERAIQAEHDGVREQIREGNEEAAVMQIPVFNGNTYTAIRELINEWSVRKGYISASAATNDPTERRSIERLTRLVMACLNSPDRPHRACPHDVIEALLQLSKTSYGGAMTVSDVEYALSQLPPDRLLPELTPSATKCIQELLTAEDPIGRSEIVVRAGISGNTWDRNWELLAALDIIEPREEAGYRRWTATLEPWYVPERRETDISAREDVPQPFPSDGDLKHVVSRSGRTTTEDVLATIALRIGKLTDDQELIESSLQPADWPVLDALESLPSGSAIDPWRGYLWALLAPGEDWVDGPPDRADRDVGVATIGTPPAESDPEQLQLSASTLTQQHATAAPTVAANGGKSKDGGDVGSQ